MSLVVGALVGPTVMRYIRSPVSPASQPIVSFTTRLAPGHRLEGMRYEPWYKLLTRTAVAISRQGQFVVYSAVDDSAAAPVKPMLYLRRMDQADDKPIAGTEGGISPFLSPDDRWVGFWADGKLMKAPVDGGVPVTICDAPVPFGASWGWDNSIVLSADFFGGISRVSADGGKSETLSEPDVTKEEMSHRLPQCLPDGKSLLFTITREWSDLRPRVALLHLKTRKWRVLLEDAADARYAPTGHIIFLRSGTLMAVPFDLGRLELTGRPVPAIAGVVQALNYPEPALNTAAGQLSVSDSGWLAYASGGILPDEENSLVWVDQKGVSQPAASYQDSFEELKRLVPTR
jgi:serine/threonine-protein kinase